MQKKLSKISVVRIKKLPREESNMNKLESNKAIEACTTNQAA